MRRVRFLASAAAVLVTASSIAGCEWASDPSPDPTTTSATPSEVETSSEPEEPTESEEPTAAEPTTPAEDDLPGTPVDGFPEAGVSLTIVGVSAQEILNLRIGPGVEYDSIARMPPDTNLVATGRNRDLGSSAGLWYQVRAGDDVGWVISTYVAELGASRDVTDRFVPKPRADSRRELIDDVVTAWGGDPSEAVVVYGPVEIEDLQFRVDVPSDDDAVTGARLFVVARVRGDTYIVTRVTATQLCARGVSGTGECED
jgi:hypothetical protein